MSKIKSYPRGRPRLERVRLQLFLKPHVRERIFAASRDLEITQSQYVENLVEQFGAMTTDER